MREFLLVSLLCLLIQPAWATVSIDSISGVSNYTITNSNGSATITIRGGIAPACTAGFTFCNDAPITAATTVVLTMHSDSKAGTLKITKSDAATVITSTGDNVAVNQVGTLQVTWANICQADTTSDNTCNLVTSPGANVTAYVGVDGTNNNLLTDSDDDKIAITFIVLAPVTGTDDTASCGTSNTGMCQFTVHDGDEKFYIANLNSPTSFPTTSRGRFSNIRVYYEKNGAVTPLSAHQDVAISYTGSTWQLATAKIDSGTAKIENDNTYNVAIGTIDEAGNVRSFVTAPTSGNSTARPSEVTGLLGSQNCFIATAAYGSPLDKHIDIFRKFRDQYLIPSKWGRQFVKIYYKNSPEYANYISQSEYLKAAVRLVLLPLWFFAWLCLQFGLWNVVGVYILVSISLYFLSRKSLKDGAFKKWFPFMLLLFSLLHPNARAQETKTSLSEPSWYENDAERNRHRINEVKKPTTVERENPLTSQGLMQIRKDGTYLYKTAHSKQDRAVVVQLSPVSFPQFKNATTGLKYKDVYGSGGFALLASYEWQFFRSAGKLGLEFGSGIMTASGTGRFKRDNSLAEEKYNLYILPNFAGLIYRFQYANKQWLVPFAEGGADYYAMAELRDDNKRNRFAMVPAAHFSGGVAILLDGLDPEAIQRLDEDNGINHIWLQLAYRMVIGLDTKRDLSDNLIGGGVTVEF